MTDLPKMTQKKSYKIEVEAGKNYSWCACGLSSTQPFCDGSHKGTGFAPTIYKAEENKVVGFCGCRMSKTGAICDGAHKTM